MKFTLSLLFLLLFAVGANAQVKKEKSLFGFGRKAEQISAGLFPDGNAPAQTVQTSAPASNPTPAPTAQRAPAPPRTSDNIFKTGTPQDVESVSYTIEDGQKVQQDSSSKRKGRIFGFGKKEKPSEVADADVIEPVPAPSYPDPQNSVTEVPTFTPAPIAERAPEPPAPRTTRTPKPVAPQVEEIEEDALVAAVVESPVAADEEEKKSGFFSRFSRKKNKEEAPVVMESTPVADVDATVPAFTAPTVAEVTTPAPAPQTPAPQPTATTPQPTFPAQPGGSDAIPSLPTFAGSPASEKPKKEKNGFRLGDPISKLRPIKQDKPLDLTGAETIIADGEIIRETEDIVENNIVSSGDGNREAPRMVNGVKTYSSWEDVDARSVSAADKILNQIR